MKNLTRMGVTCLLGGAAIAIAASPLAIASDPRQFSLQVTWSANISAAAAPPPVGTTSIQEQGIGLVLSAMATSPDGRIAFLGNQVTKTIVRQVVLPDVERTLDQQISLQLKGVLPNFSLNSLVGNQPPAIPYITTLAFGATGETWVGGGSDTYRSSFDRDAYLARIDETGNPLWEHTYASGPRGGIRGMARTSAGDMVVVGAAGREGWVARISPDGRTIWERRLGTDASNAVTAITNDRFVVIGLEAADSMQAKNYQQDVVAWIIDGSGKTLERTLIRTGIATSAGTYFERISVSSTKSAVFIQSSWDTVDAKPTQISKLTFDGRVLWTALLPNTCQAALATPPEGGAIVACGFGGQVHLYQLDDSSGNVHESVLALPDCQSRRIAALFLAFRKDRAMTLGGSRPLNSSGENCSWIGRLAEIP